jgi:hypothetical protein
MTGHTDTDLTARLAAALNEEGCLGCEEFEVDDTDSGCPDCEDLFRAARALLPVVREYGDQRAAEARGKLAEEIATLMAGRMHLGPTSMGRLSAILDVARDPGLLEEAGRET